MMFQGLLRGPERTIVRLGHIVLKILYYSISIYYTLHNIICGKFYIVFVVPYVVPLYLYINNIYGIYIKKSH